MSIPSLERSTRLADGVWDACGYTYEIRDDRV